MRLFHGTAAFNLEAILAEGVRPRSFGKKTKKGNWDKAPSHPDVVYMTTAYAPFFALQAGSMRKRDRRGVVLEIETDELSSTHMVPDEDAIEQSSRGKDGYPDTWTIEYRTAFYRSRLTQYKGSERWPKSVEALGTCGHIGTVPPWAIKRYVVFDWMHMPETAHFCLNPTITIANYSICGPRYRSLTAWLFGDETPEYKEGDFPEGMTMDIPGGGVLTRHWELPPEDERKFAEVFVPSWAKKKS